MKSVLRSIIGLVVIIVLAAGITLFISWAGIPDLIASNLSKKLKVSVEIGDIDLSLKSFNIEKIQMGNPPHSILSKAFSSEIMTITTPITRYLDRHIVIDEIVLDQIYLGLEFNSSRNAHGNWTTIMKNYQEAIQATPHTKENKEERRSVLIQKLILRNISTDVLYRQDNGKINHLPLIPEIILKNVSSEGGFPIDQITNSVLGQMLRAVFEREHLENMLEDVFKDIERGRIDKLLKDVLP